MSCLPTFTHPPTRASVLLQGLRGHPSLYPHAVPLPSELAAPPPAPDTAAQAGRRLQRFADEALEELDTLRQVTAMSLAGLSPGHLNHPMGRMATRCHDLDIRLHFAMLGDKLAGGLGKAGAEGC